MTEKQTNTDEPVEYQRRNNRYPWWVKTVNQITTETDETRHSKPDMDSIMYNGLIEAEESQRRIEKSKEVVAEAIRNSTPGKSVRDLALHYAANTYQSFTVGSLGDPYFNPQPGIQKIRESWKLHPPQTIGLPAWNASEQKASHTVEKAGIQLGAAMVGFTTINPLWTRKHVEISPDVDEQTQDGMKAIIPERMKYIVNLLGVNPPDLTLRNKTELGAAGDRAGYEAAFMATTRMIRFIRGLGYDAVDATPILSQIPHAIAAGLGELGRMNRMVNPLFGGNVRIGSVLTDLPLALDKPIDFGLQRFCVSCKKCATACPVGALSTEDEPFWEPFNQWQGAGKKAYFEDNKSCKTYQGSKDIYCSACLSVCPWSKQDKTMLHEVAHILAARLPFLAKWLVLLDDLFGYGLIDDGNKLEDWWDQESPVRGVDSAQGRRLFR